jgi:hypothetical protein
VKLPLGGTLQARYGTRPLPRPQTAENPLHARIETESKLQPPPPESPRTARSRVAPLPARPVEVSLHSTSRPTLSRISSLASLVQIAPAERNATALTAHFVRRSRKPRRSLRSRLARFALSVRQDRNQSEIDENLVCGGWRALSSVPSAGRREDARQSRARFPRAKRAGARKSQPRATSGARCDRREHLGWGERRSREPASEQERLPVDDRA